ncbi:MAG TPA: hypothetical protein VMW09_04880 [Desulfatiglandales bacterium]|nr:hypothetical protein [Desulfatiglandales bacterium]
MATIKQSDNFHLRGDCDNFLIPDKCNKWIIDKFEKKEFLGKIDYPTPSDYEKADQICSQCFNFKPSK